MCNSFSREIYFDWCWVCVSVWERAGKDYALVSDALYSKQMCFFAVLFGFRLHFTLISLGPFRTFFRAITWKIWYNCFVRLLHFALHNCQVENYLVSGVLGYWIKTKHEREGKRKRISFAAIVSNCVMWHTQWTITHNFFLTEYNYSALLFSFHLVPSQSLSVSHTSQQCKRKHLSACLIISIFISVFQRSLRTNAPKTEFCAFYDQFECYLMSSIQSKPTRCDRFAQFSGLNSSTRLNKTDTTFFRYIQMWESHQEQN